VFRFGDCLVTTQAVSKFHCAKRLCDIGANKGQWTYVFHQLNPQLEEVVMFEPQALFAQELQRLKLPMTKKRIFQYALGEREQKLAISGGTASASLLEASANQHRYFPDSIKQESESAEVRLLDEVYRSNGLHYPDLIKIDVQGYELNALKGAIDVLAHASYLVIELSLREFYLGQPPLWELLRFLDEQQYIMVDHGYELRSGTPPHELLQLDAIFANRRFM
jgi:FkbM family methyltransferase